MATIDLTWSSQETEFRAEARKWLEANVPTDLPSGDTREGFVRHHDWEQRLFEDRWAVVMWPYRYGGRDATIWEWLIFEEEYHRAGGPQRISQNGILLLAPALFEFGTDTQNDALLTRMAAAEDVWCQGWSEPGAGSDLAAISSHAQRAEGGWVLNGQKTWTTRGAFCTHLFGLFRTDGSGRPHEGLTYFLVPLDAEGVTVRGFGRLDGDEGFAEVFFDDVHVGDEAVLGEVDAGWHVAMSTTEAEHGLMLRSPGRFLSTARRLLSLCSQHGASPELHDRAVDGWIRAEAYNLFAHQSATRLADGERLGPESSLNKIWWSELDIELHEIALDTLGPDAEVDGPWNRGWQFALAGPIYAGTNEIQRTIAAERLLGLPRGSRR